MLPLPAHQKVKCFRVCFRFQLLLSASASTKISPLPLPASACTSLAQNIIAISEKLSLL